MASCIIDWSDNNTAALVDGAEHRMAVGIDIVALLPRLPQRGRPAVEHVQPSGKTLVQHDLLRHVAPSVL